eukprot:1401792-Prymnesium_polylepis.1
MSQLRPAGPARRAPPPPCDTRFLQVYGYTLTVPCSLHCSSSHAPAGHLPGDHASWRCPMSDDAGRLDDTDDALKQALASAVAIPTPPVRFGKVALATEHQRIAPGVS